MTRIAVFGAGAIGCWVGGMLAAGGAEVTLIGRPRVLDELAQGLRVTDLAGGDHRVTVRTASDAGAAASADIVLVTVKSAATHEAATALAAIARPVVSLQNGVRNVDVLRARLPQTRAGMVPFNVVRRAPASYHRASAGTIMIEASPELAPLAALMPMQARRDMPAVQWSKLLMNLNNAINALSGIPLAEELSQRAYRRCLAAAQREALELIAEARIALARVTPVPARWLPRLLALPDPVFRVLARRVVAIDPVARSSMWEDLEAKRVTEVDYIQGEIVALAERLRKRAPVNAALVALVRAAEAGGRRDYTGDELLTALTAARAAPA